MEERPLNESLWRRGWRDTIPIWASWQFVLLDAVVCVVIGGFFEWYWGLAFFAFAAFCVWLGATAKAPIVQRNEARKGLCEKESRGETERQQLGKQHAIGNLIMEGSEVLRFLHSPDRLSQFWPIEEFKIWQKHCSEILRQYGLVDYMVLFFRAMSIDIQKASLDDLEKACNAGLDTLGELFRSLRY